jgi:hypothetical protein
VRRTFVEAQPHYPEASEILDRIGQLYAIEAEAKLCGVEPRAYLREATLRAVRNPGAVTLARDLK